MRASTRRSSTKTFAAVQAQLAANNRQHRTRVRAKEPNLLAGLLFNSNGKPAHLLAYGEERQALPVLRRHAHRARKAKAMAAAGP